MKTFIVVLVIVVVLYYAYVTLISLPIRRKQKQHTEALQDAGAEFSFLPQEAYGPFDQKKEFPCQPHTLMSMGGKFGNVLQGTSSLGRTWLFEYEYETGSGDTASSYIQTVAAFQLSDCTLPDFSLKPAKVLRYLIPIDLLQKANRALMNNEIIFRTYPAFSRSYQMNGPDEEAIQSIFQPAVLEYWEGLPAKESWASDGSSKWLIVYRDNKQVPPSELKAFLRKAQEIASLFLSHAAGTAESQSSPG